MQPKRQDEIQLYAMMRSTRSESGVVLGSRIRSICELTGINQNRAFRLIEKWEARGWFEMSSCPPGGWFTKMAPDHLDVYMPQ